MASSLVLAIELLCYSASSYGLRWLGNDIVLRLSIFYIPLYVILEGILGGKKLYFENNIYFNILLKIIGLGISIVLAIYIKFSTLYYIPIMFTFSGLFLIIQTMTIINMSFDLTMKLVEQHILVIMSISFVGYIGIISYCVFELTVVTNLFVVVHLILLFTFTIISILPKIQENIPCSGLLSSCIIGLQASFFLIGSFSSSPLNETVLILGLIINILSLIKSVINHAMAWDHPLVYHCIIILSLFYFTSVITNWDSSGGIYDIGKSEVGLWVKITCSWFTFLLYGWCLLAPLVLPHRDFGYQSNTSTF